jgi:hypothetical protein
MCTKLSRGYGRIGTRLFKQTATNRDFLNPGESGPQGHALALLAVEMVYLCNVPLCKMNCDGLVPVIDTEF